VIVHEQWTNQLSDYLDGELSAEERRDVDAHLEGCANCTAVLNDLKRVVTRAASVPPRPPQADLWGDIAARIETGASSSRDTVLPLARRESRRFTFTLPQLAAAAALLIAVSGGVAWEVARRAVNPDDLRQSGSVARVTANPSGPDSSADAAPFKPVSSEGTGAADFARVETVGMADAQYDAAVADLEKALKADRDRLDASTIAIVEHNLQIIDQAINQARDALVADPANSYLSSHLVEARRRKLDLLRRATALATETN
jgi:anti-sigma factor RsiW